MKNSTVVDPVDPRMIEWKYLLGQAFGSDFPNWFPGLLTIAVTEKQVHYGWIFTVMLVFKDNRDHNINVVLQRTVRLDEAAMLADARAVAATWLANGYRLFFKNVALNL